MVHTRCLTALLILLVLTGMLVSVQETRLIKNCTVFLPDSTYRENAFIMIQGARIHRIGSMKELQPGIFDREIDAEGAYVYPALIDAYCTGFQQSGDPEKEEKSPRSGSVDKTRRPPYSRRGYHMANNAVDALELKKSSSSKVLRRGFSCLHVAPPEGIVTGATSVISLVSQQVPEVVLIPQKFMHIYLKPGRGAYPSTLASLAAELEQMKIDSLYRHGREGLWRRDGERVRYLPELDILLPYWKQEKRFLFQAPGIVEQRLVEILAEKLDVDPVLVGHSDIWRRRVDPRRDVILPLTFTPPASSRWSKMGEETRKKAEKEMYPRKLAEFIRRHPDICLVPPKSGEYPELFKNIRRLMKEKVSEALLIRSLTANPARLLNISAYLGTIAPGKLASLVLSDQKLFAEKARIQWMVVEGHIREMKRQKLKKPATDLSGNWTVNVESGMGNMPFAMVLKQDGNYLSGKMVSQMGDMQISEGTISGTAVNIVITAPIMGRDTTVVVSGSYEEERISGTMTIGSLGEGRFEARRDEERGGQQ